MRRLFAVVLVLACASASARSPETSCCAGLGPTPSDCQRLSFVAKSALDTSQQCPSGTAMRTIVFKHNLHENMTHQESFQLVCCPSQSRVTNRCRWGPLMLNFYSGALAKAPANSVITGVRFKRNAGENYPRHQSYAIRSCELEKPKPIYFPRRPPRTTTKWHLESHVSCALVVDGQEVGLADSLTIEGLRVNGTHGESVEIGCVND